MYQEYTHYTQAKALPKPLITILLLYVLSTRGDSSTANQHLELAVWLSNNEAHQLAFAILGKKKILPPLMMRRMAPNVSTLNMRL